MTTNLLFKLLQLDDLPVVVDIGANPLDGGEPPYQEMLKAGLCHLIGFEPQPEAFQALQAQKSDHETYFPYAIGDGSDKLLYICVASGMTSTLKPSEQMLGLFNDFPYLGTVKETTTMPTKKLDEIKEIERIDFLKIDVQGGELEIFRSASNLLKTTVAIQTEISFIPLYEKQPTFGEVDIFLRSLGFIPHAIPALKRWPLAPTQINGNSRQALNQVLEADIVYVRDFTAPENMNWEQWKRLALIAHYCYRSYDLTMRAIQIMENADILGKGSTAKYIEILNQR